MSDDDLVHVKRLTQLHQLALMKTPVTDAGLVNLKNLTNLETLFLVDTETTEDGVAALQQALPNTAIHARKTD